MDWNIDEVKKLVEHVAAARKAAYAAAPRSGGNDHVEASLFLAMLKAVDEFESPPAAAEPTAPPSDQEPLPPVEPLTDDEPLDEPLHPPEVNYDRND